MPVSPTKRWCASSVSMNFVERASGSKPLSASAASWYLPSRSVRNVNMKNESQSRRLLVERAEDARLVRVARAALEQRVALLAAVATEVGVEQVDHRPEVTALLDVHLVEVAEIVERRARPAERALLLDARRLGVALRDDDPAEVRPVLARHLVPDRLPLVRAERRCVRPSSGGVRKMPQR